MPPSLRRWMRLLGLGLALIASPAVQAQGERPESTAEALQVSLLTFAPGAVYWQRFGHNALLVRDRRSGESLVFNYGLFDFHQENFFLNFARGRMLYRLDTESLQQSLRQYRAEGRWAVEQRLALTPAQRLELVTFLNRNALPENAEYRYDYFRDNCSTRVRDALDQVLDGALRRALEPVSTPLSYRAEGLRLMSPVLPLAIGMDAALGPAADRPLNLWEASFVPMTLMGALREIQIADAQGVLQPLVEVERRLVQGRGLEAPDSAPHWLAGFAMSGVALGAVLLALAYARPRFLAARLGFGLLASLFAVGSGLAGLVLAAFWGLTEHWATWRNPHLLLLSPISLLLVPTWLGAARRGWRPGRFQLGLGLTAALLSLVSVFCLLDSRIGAPLLPWMALLIPVHLALAVALWHALRVSDSRRGETS